MTERNASGKRWPGQFRLVGAAALALAFFLPVSSCSSSGLSRHESTQVISPGAERRYRYPFKMLAFDNPKSVLIVFAYFWPAVALVYRKFSRKKIGRKVTAVELPLCFLSIYVVSTLAFLETLEIGAYLAIAGAAFYLLAASTIFTEKIRRRLRRLASGRTEQDEGR